MARGQRYSRKRHSPILRWVSGLVLGGLFAIVVFKHEFVAEALDFMTPVRHVRVEGNFDGLEPGQFEAALRPKIQHGFFLLRLEELEAAANEVPWVGKVLVSRIWPDTLVFSIDELDPVARWGERQLIAATGEIFDRPASRFEFDQLTRLQGPLGRERELLEMRERLALKFQEKGERIEQLVLSDRLAWTVKLGSGLEINYGNQPPLIATDRLFAFLPALRAQSQRELRSIDLRYPRGFAVSFRPVPMGDAAAQESKG